MDFQQELRHMCRNPKCRMKLPEPVENPREAFCTRGCYGSFYLHRCLICEEPITPNRKICRKPECRRALAVGVGLGRFFAKTGQGIAECETNSRSACAARGYKRLRAHRRLAHRGRRTGPVPVPLRYRRRWSGRMAGRRLRAD